MSKTLYLECYSGISGDMTVAALLDLGADKDVLLKSIESLNLTGYEICTAQDVIGRVALIKNNFGQRKRLTTGFVWRHLPACIKKYYLKIYRIVVKLQPTDYED